LAQKGANLRPIDVKFKPYLHIRKKNNCYIPMILVIRVLTPDGVVYNDEVNELIFPSRNGQVGILPGHAELVTALDIGALIYRKQSNWNSIALIGGYAWVKKNNITILVHSARTSESTNRREAEKLLKEATDRLNSAEGEQEQLEACQSFKRARTLYQIAKLDSILSTLMSKYKGPRLRIIRRLGLRKLEGLTTKIPKNGNRPGQHGRKRTKQTQFSNRLKEKQKLRFYYGISESQTIRYVKQARKRTGVTGLTLLCLLENRLDAVLYNLQLASTIPIARQMITHGHVFVNGKRTNIPSFAFVSSKKESNFTIEVIRGTKASSVVCSKHYVPIESRTPPTFLNEMLVLEYYSNRFLIL